MSARARALLIGMLGPVLQALGLVWDLLDHGVFSHGQGELITLEHIVSGPAHLMMGTGFALALVCIPLALRVAIARPEELERPRQQTAPLLDFAELTSEAAE